MFGIIRDVLINQFRFLAFMPIRPDLDRHGNAYLAWGFLTAWLAGVGRYWDNPRAELWQTLGLGSVIYIVVMAFILWAVVKPLYPKSWSYRNVLIFVGLTSLPAILYAIPVERFVSMRDAQSINVLFLAIVAAWRVALLFRYLLKSAGLPLSAVVVAALLPLTVIVTVLTMLNLEHVVFNLMAGLRESDVSEHDRAYGVLMTITVFSVFAFPVLFLSYLSVFFTRRKAIRDAKESDAP